MKPLYLLSVVITSSCQFVGTVDNLLCLSFYLVTFACPSSLMLYGSRMSHLILVYKSLPVLIRSIPTQKAFKCALKNLRKVQESKNLVSES